MIPETDLDAMEARANAATEGPWGTMGIEYDCGSPCTVDGCNGHESNIKSILDGPQPYEYEINFERPEDAAFIAASRTDMPALIAEVRELQAENERLRDVLRQALTCFPVSEDEQMSTVINAALERRWR